MIPGLSTPLLVGAAVAFGLLLAAVGIQTWRLDGAVAENAALAVQLEDAGRKIERQNKAIDEHAQAAELAKAQKDVAVAEAREQVRLHQSRADALRLAMRAAAPRSPATSAASFPGATTQPRAPPPADRSAEAAVAEVRRALRP